MAGYDGVGISAIKGMCEHLNLERYAEQKNEIKEVLAETGLELLASEVASTDPDRLELAFTVAADLGIPVINVGPGGK
jgi:sugar phosphate isomerase/epimerase